MSHSTSPMPTMRGLGMRRDCSEDQSPSGRPQRAARVVSRSLALAVAAVALAGLADGLGVVATVGSEGAADVVALLELALRLAADEAPVSAGGDHYAFPGPAVARRS